MCRKLAAANVQPSSKEGPMPASSIPQCGYGSLGVSQQELHCSCPAASYTHRPRPVLRIPISTPRAFLCVLRLMQRASGGQPTAGRHRPGPDAVGPAGDIPDPSHRDPRREYVSHLR